jgi:hypothetical protein
MNKFIKLRLTDVNNEENSIIYVNVNAIKFLKENKFYGDKNTTIEFIDSTFTTVNESYQDIALRIG